MLIWKMISDWVTEPFIQMLSHLNICGSKYAKIVKQRHFLYLNQPRLVPIEWESSFNRYILFQWRLSPVISGTSVNVWPFIDSSQQLIASKVNVDQEGWENKCNSYVMISVMSICLRQPEHSTFLIINLLWACDAGNNGRSWLDLCLLHWLLLYSYP